jgi:phage FluMu protein Com
MIRGRGRGTRKGRTMVILAALVALALALAAFAQAEKAVTVRAGNLVLTFNGGVTPKALSKTKMEPISLNVQGKIAEADGSQPPPLTEAVVDTDKNGMIDVKGVPKCKPGQLEAQTSAAAEKICKPALLGTGTTDVSVLFPESKPVALHSKLLAFNGGEKGGVTTIYIHAFLSTPVTAALVTTVKISKEHKGPYGTRSVATVPKIAGYDGSVTSFSLNFKKKLFAYKGKKHGYLLAKCPTGKFVAQAEAKFHDGTKVGPAQITRSCTP